jgi:hypothetical protein
MGLNSELAKWRGIVMRVNRLVGLTIMLFISLVACAKDQSMILEKRDVQFFKVAEVNATSGNMLELSGLAFHSALVVRKLETIKEGNSLIVLIELVPTQPKMSGSFNYKIPIPAGVETVRFGKSREVIWSRDGSPLK